MCTLIKKKYNSLYCKKNKKEFLNNLRCKNDLMATHDFFSFLFSFSCKTHHFIIILIFIK
uniref:Uncharacterized protein n=1 Tax=Strongyloides venezuelensis TaxID=75913 RepID=A0A0K0FLV3_STRVS